MSRCVVFGSSGFTGRGFQRFVLGNDFARQLEFVWASRRTGESADQGTVSLDVTDHEELTRFLIQYRPEYIINFAVKTASTDAHELMEVNAYFPLHLLNLVVDQGLKVRKILLVGSAAEYGPDTSVPTEEHCPLMPCNLYGLSKRVQTETAAYFARVHDVPVCLARPFNILDPSLPAKFALPSFAQQINAAGTEGEIEVGNLAPRRDFLSLRDVMSAYALLLEKGRGGEAYNVCSGVSHSIESLVKRMIEVSGKRITLRTNESLFRSHEIMESRGSNAKLKRETGWEPSDDIFDVVSELLR